MIIIIILMVGGYLKVDRDFVGREPLYRAISQDVQSACSGHSWLIALEGAPGIGKSTILSAIINDTKKANTLVVDSRAYEDVDLPPYWLWVPIVRALRSRLSATAFELSARIASDHGVPLDWLEKYESAEHGEAERRQIRLLEAIFAIIEAVVEDGPVVIPIDDLHRADKQSLFLLQYLLASVELAQRLVALSHATVAAHELPIGILAEAVLGQDLSTASDALCIAPMFQVILGQATQQNQVHLFQSGAWCDCPVRVKVLAKEIAPIQGSRRAVLNERFRVPTLSLQALAGLNARGKLVSV